ncbi:hypothetical protein PBI_OVECHKIN_95 [Mycobacterium phage Ovechkin]|uniref:Uncharacterized protein n=1 Tax=Mycobacterium phage Ovechkin TaxID=1673889 RepID=A0A0H4TIA9_9CAUD|nr:hypothetical protein PBI_OVECHKIN_95 [Mycobacterium phage Ovechkin]AKQ06997.1 hypothetical protein PBI_OVECHKIN_95 [Mycobacterium phage Ovechkin]
MSGVFPAPRRAFHRLQRTPQMSLRYRYASTLGDRYALPMYFDTVEDVKIHKALSDKHLTGLPGHDSMRIEEFVDGEWIPVDVGSVVQSEPNQEAITDV